MKKSFKYFAIIFINTIVLIGLSKIWIDSFALKINPDVQFVEPLKIIGFSILSLIGIRLLVIFFRERNIQSVKMKIKLSALLTLLICSYIYIDYSVKIVNNQILFSELRKELLNKVIIDHEGISGYNRFALDEYKQFSGIKGYYELPSEAQNIEFNWFRPSFLGDYSFKVTFDLPLDSDIEEIDFRDGDFQITQKVVKLKNKFKITYEESQS